ncbi:MAG: hypothetical protein K9N23_15695 [Akkermansiaceae bacterium]|nr:hypothetical protein [Akkermansiaceae bacterium]MCF7733133.1 hypothetical protein [Akkermansiaceae bacterium]
MIPSKPPSSASPAVLRMFRLLRKLSDDFTIWHRASRRDSPQFLLVWRERHAFLIQVAATSQELAETALQPSLFGEDDGLTPDSLGLGERQALAGFPFQRADAVPAVRRLVVFPHVDEATIDQVELLRSSETGVAFLGLHQTAEDRFVRRIEALAEAPLPQRELLALRQGFTPESVISGSPARRPLLERGEATPEEPLFLDFDQESLTKIDLELPPACDRAVQAAESRLVTGPAGCGKSLVLLHRALSAARLNRGARLLILTHNRPINAELRRRAVATAPEGSRIQGLTFFQWAARILKPPVGKIIADYETHAIISRIATGIPGLGKLSPRFLTDEIGYLRDLGIHTIQAYLELEREGRFTGLTADRRHVVWAVLGKYREILANDGLTDWHERALEFQDFATSQPEKLDKHDFVFIDEAQFFAKIWFTPVLASLAAGGQLFLAADPTQGFLKRRQSWLAAGIEVRGRATRLAVPYRSTRAILEFAVRWLTRRKPLHPAIAADDLDPPDAAEMLAVPVVGEAPRVVQTASAQDSLATVVKMVADLSRQSPWLAGSVLVLHTDSRATGTVIAMLRRHLGPAQVRDFGDKYDPAPSAAFCAVSNLKAATGLEAAVVFLLGIDWLLAKEGDPRLDADARAELAADHTHLIYMAATRAARQLVVLTHTTGVMDFLLAIGATRQKPVPRQVTSEAEHSIP